MSEMPDNHSVRLDDTFACLRWCFDLQLNLLLYRGRCWLFEQRVDDQGEYALDQLCSDGAIIAAHKQALRGVANSFEWQHGESTFLVSLTPLLDAQEQTIGVEAVALDVSAYKAVEHDLQSLKQHAESILNAAGEGIYGIGLDGAATFVNPAAERMTGWTAEESIGQQIHYQHHHSHEDGSPYPREDCAIYAAIHDGQVHHVADEVFWRKDGSCFPVEYTSTPMYQDGALIGAVAVFKDTSERKKAQTELMAAFAEVEQLKEQLQQENSYLQEEIREGSNFGHIVGTSKPVRMMLQQIEQVANTDVSVLVLGESGTGKELIARAIHDHSPRKDQTLIKLNCGAISSGLVESELFGHEKGAFTGAHDRRKGRFELADGGTLFLDEVGELPLETQVKLLRVLQEQEFERLGSEKTLKVDVRIVAATNRDLAQQVAEGTFREDLYYRLNVFPIEVPPLRERAEDVPLLARYFMERAAKKFAKPLRGFDEKGLQALQAYHWPGNIRELQNVIERAAIVSMGSVIQLTGLLPEAAPKVDMVAMPLMSLQDVERNHIQRVLNHTRGVIAGPNGAAKILAMHPNTLRSRMIKLEISQDDIS
jgi:PAS domain S-box-containing protein